MQTVLNNLKIPLEETRSNPVFIGENSRLSSATSVVILDKNHLACAHFAGQKMYLYEFDFERGESHLLSSCDTTYNGKRCKTDLMTSDRNGRLAVSNFVEKTCTLYRYGSDKLELLSSIPFVCGDVVHGVKFFSSDIMAMTSRRQSSGTHFFEIGSGVPILHMDIGRSSVQDLCFLGDNRLAMVSTTASPSLQPKEIWASVVDLVEFNIEKKTYKIVKSAVIERSHLDNVVEFDNKLYITNQYANLVVVLDSNSLEVMGELTGFDFPHGIDVYGGYVAVSNYGSNTIEIRRL